MTKKAQVKYTNLVKKSAGQLKSKDGVYRRLVGKMKVERDRSISTLDRLITEQTDLQLEVTNTAINAGVQIRKVGRVEQKLLASKSLLKEEKGKW